MTNVMKNEKGMTLLEIIVVLAVIGALAAMLAPVTFRYIDDANRARAQADAQTLATAIQRMYADTGRWSLYASGTGSVAYTSGTDAAYLTSDSDCTTTLSACTGASATVLNGTAGWTAGGKVDSLTRQLITNTPSYTTSGPRAWKGPYTEAIPETDAWGQAYLVNIGQAAPGTNNAVLVISPGPNGLIETAGNSTSTTNVVAGGDDIIARVK